MAFCALSKTNFHASQSERVSEAAQSETISNITQLAQSERGLSPGLTLVLVILCLPPPRPCFQSLSQIIMSQFLLVILVISIRTVKMNLLLTLCRQRTCFHYLSESKFRALCVCNF